MKNHEFCHLHIHTEYSVLDGLSSCSDYATRANELGQKYLAITDHGNIDGYIAFQKACKENDIKPIFGCECYITNDLRKKEKTSKSYHVTLLIKDEQGFINLNRMLTIANLDGFYYRPRIDYDLLYKHSDGLIVMSACLGSLVNSDDGIDLMLDLNDKKKGDCYFEVMPHIDNKQIDLNAKVAILSRNHGIELVATNDCHYIDRVHWKDHEVLLAIQSKKVWTDKTRFKFAFKGLYLKSARAMENDFKRQDALDKTDYIRAMQNTSKIANLCNFELKKREIKLPTIKEIENKVEDSYLAKLCNDGYRDKIRNKQELNMDGPYWDRYRKEFELLRRKGFIRYFLIVWELVNWCKKNDIMIGPGRGSVGGSLIAYLIGITSVDPLKYGLIFERFISESRIDYPDIDIDFENIKRDLVKKHLVDRYGENNVAGVTTYQRMKGKNTIRDVSRVFAIDQHDVNEFANIIGYAKSDEAMILKAVEETEEGKRFDKKYSEIVDIALTLEGQIRAYSRHAAAMIVSSYDLTNGEIGYLADRGDNIVINWEGKHAEFMGLIKIDILGLKEISILAETKRLVKKNYNHDLIFEEIEFNDKKIFREFAIGNTEGIFQFNSRGLTELCKKLRPTKFMDLVHANALHRPGTIGGEHIEQFIKRRNGGKYALQNKAIDKIAKDTYGIIIYQEQMMKICNEVAGMSLEDADKIRKIIGKSKGIKEIAEYKDKFVNGCQDVSDLTLKEARDLWNLLEQFSGYAFNLSHSVEYTMLAYWGQYCKVKYPTEFLSANLTFTTDVYKKSRLIEDALKRNVSIMTPKIGLSDAIKWVVKNNIMYAPFVEVKGIGEATAKKIASSNAVKKKGFFTKETLKESYGSKVDSILKDIKAHDRDALPDSFQHFDFEFSQNIEIKYPKLFDYIGRDYFPIDSEDIVNGKVYFKDTVSKRRFKIDDNLMQCKACSLSKECHMPVNPSPGDYNVMIIGEAPGKVEDEKGKGFTGPAGEILWKHLDKYNLDRNYFHITNVCKCFPSLTKTPEKESVAECFERWLLDEIESIDCRVALALGNTALKAFNENSEGITALNAKTKWNEKYELWIAYCIHPASVLYDNKNNKAFGEGIKNFVNTFNTFCKD